MKSVDIDISNEHSVDFHDNTQKSVRRTNNNTYLVYLAQLIIFAIIVISAGISNRGHSVLILFTIIYWAIATLPILFVNIGWGNPLIYQMLFEIPKVLSLACRSTGHIEIYRKWIVPVSYSETVDVYIKCCIITCVGLLIEYYIMLYVPINTKKACFQFKKSWKPFIILLASVFSLIMLMRGLGGFTYVLSNYKSRLTEFDENTNLYFRYMVYWGTIPCMYFFLTEQKKFFFVSLFVNIVSFIAIGERGGLIISLGASLILVTILKRDTSIKLSRIILPILLFVLVYDKMGSFRDNNETSIEDSFNWKIEESISQFIETMGNIQHFVISSEVIYNVENGNIPRVCGKPLLNIFVAPLPRKLFPWKPTYIADSALVGSLLLDTDTNVFGLPPGVFAYGYLNFGWIGVILFSIICGYFMKWLYSVLVLKYHELGQSIPNGNIILYTLSISCAYTIISTEAQIKLIENLIGFGILYLLLINKGSENE